MQVGISLENGIHLIFYVVRHYQLNVIVLQDLLLLSFSVTGKFVHSSVLMGPSNHF